MKSIVPRKLSRREMQALDGSIREQIGASVDKLKSNIEAIVLWRIHVKYGYGPKRLDDFLVDLQEGLQELNEFYGIEDASDTELACVQQLRSIGFDTSKLGKAFQIDYTINKRK